MAIRPMKIDIPEDDIARVISHSESITLGWPSNLRHRLVSALL